MKKFLILLASAAFSVLAVAAESDHEYKLVPQNRACSDTTSVLCIGNSFTYFYDSYNMLKEIAWSQGHYLDVKAAYVGGYTFQRHLADLKTISAIESFNKPYEVVFLQNQSQVNAFYGRNPKQYKSICDDAVELAARVRTYSPDAVVYLESTWSYEPSDCGGFGTLEAFDKYLMLGTAKMAKASRCKLSPITLAFAAARAKHPEINLFYRDMKHQGPYGSYLKSCVNYLLMFGSFDGPVSDCGLDPNQTAILRAIAAEVVSRR